MPSDIASLPVDYLFTMDLVLGKNAVMPNGPHGTRVFAPVLSGTVTGPNIRATVLPGADWVHVRSDGFAQLNVRLTLQSDDGCVIAMEYKGILSAGADRRPISAPLFEAGDARYAWLNNVQAVGIGTPGKDSVSYEVYALR
jgi:Protein of unknown function (DUF3237)